MDQVGIPKLYRKIQEWRAGTSVNKDNAISKRQVNAIFYSCKSPQRQLIITPGVCSTPVWYLYRHSSSYVILF